MMNATKLPHDTPPFPTSVPEDNAKTPGADLRRSNEVVSATGRMLDWPSRGPPLQ